MILASGALGTLWSRVSQNCLICGLNELEEPCPGWLTTGLLAGGPNSALAAGRRLEFLAVRTPECPRNMAAGCP